MILRCTCKHEYMDKRYGNANRVMNKTTKKGMKPQYRCTVCGNTKEGK